MSGGTRCVKSGQGNPSDDDDPPPPPSTAEIMMDAERNHRDQTRLLELIAKNTSLQRDAVISIQDFVLLNPPVFRCSSEPLDADDWLRSIERKLETAHVSPDDRVMFVAYFLEGAAGEWWESFVAIQPDGHVVTWQEFRDAFQGYHILDELMERKREEFCTLSQGSMTVHQYRTEFNRLSRYAPEKISTDAKKQARFRKGLSPVLRHDLNLLEFVNFEDLVNRSFRAKHGNEVFEESRKRDRELAPSSSSTSRKRRIWIPNSALPSHLFPRPPPQNNKPQKCSREHAIKTPIPNTRVCYKCGNPGHIARQCSFPQSVPPRPKHKAKAKPPKSSKAKSAVVEHGRVNHVTLKEAQEDTKVVLGTLPVNSKPASILFDSGASNSFLCEKFALLHDISFEELPTSFMIKTPGSIWRTSRVSHDNEIVVEDLVFLASLIALKSSS